MSQQENFYTYQELKDFTNNFTDLTILNISKFIETQTNKKYCVVERQMVCDLNKQLFDNNIAILDIQRFLNDIWDKNSKNSITQDLTKDVQNFLTKEWAVVVERNHLIIYRWKDELKEFEVPNSSKSGDSK